MAKEIQFASPFHVLDAAAKNETGNLFEYFSEEEIKEWQDAINAGITADITTMEPRLAIWREVAEIAELSATLGAGLGLVKTPPQHPALSTACLRFSSTAYATLFPKDIIAYANIGEEDNQGGIDDADPARAQAEQQARYINEFVKKKISGWKNGQEQILYSDTLYGMACKWILFDDLTGEFLAKSVLPWNFIFNHNHTGELETLPRYGIVEAVTRQEVLSLCVTGDFARPSFLENDLENLEAAKPTTPTDGEKDGDALTLVHEWVYHDTDNDSIPEPYRVTLLYDCCPADMRGKSGDIVRIEPAFGLNDILGRGGKPVVQEELPLDKKQTPRVVKVKRFDQVVQSWMLPCPKGTMARDSIGIKMASNMRFINGVLHTIAEAGMKANAGGGLVSNQVRPSIGSQFGQRNLGGIRASAGQWQYIDVPPDTMIAQHFMENRVLPPDGTLLAMVQFMLGDIEKQASMEVVGFDSIPANMGETVAMTILQEGKSLKNSILYRLLRPTQQEIDILVRLLKEHGDDAAKQLFGDGVYISPIADPDASAAMSLAHRAQLHKEIILGTVGVPIEPYDKGEGFARMFKAAGEKDLQTLLPPPKEPTPEDTQQQQVTLEGAAAEVGKLKSEIANKDADTHLKRVTAEAKMIESGSIVEDIRQKNFQRQAQERIAALTAPQETAAQEQQEPINQEEEEYEQFPA